jgi:hypothetical protein
MPIHGFYPVDEYNFWSVRPFFGRHAHMDVEAIVLEGLPPIQAL